MAAHGSSGLEAKVQLEVGLQPMGSRAEIHDELKGLLFP